MNSISLEIAIITAIGSAFVFLITMWYNNNKSVKSFDISVQPAIESRKKLQATWEEFFDYYQKLGYNREFISNVIVAIKNHSPVAKIMILPHDHLYRDLKIDSMLEQDDEMMKQIEQKIDGFIYEDGELIDNDVDSVYQLFQFIKERQKQNNNQFLKL